MVCVTVLAVALSVLTGCQPTTQTSPAVTTTQAAAPLPRIGVKDGQFVELPSGKLFKPRGFNYIRGRDIGYVWHDTFNPKRYDPVTVEAALADIGSHGFNTVRVFIDPKAEAGTVLNRQAAELSPVYMDNVCNFLQRARAHGIHVIVAMCDRPETDYYDQIAGPPPANIRGANLDVVNPGHIKAKAQYIADFAAGIAKRDRTLLTTLFSYELDNETNMVVNQPPFSVREGQFTLNGKSYDLSVEAEHQRLADDAVRLAADTTVDAVRKVDPEAMVSINVFTFKAVRRTGPGRTHTDTGRDVRFPARPMALVESKLAYLDIHLYSIAADWLADDLKSVEWDKLLPACRQAGKPLLMGEFGAFRGTANSAVQAAERTTDHARRVLGLGFAGFLLWTYDTDEQNFIWNAKKDGGPVFRAMAELVAKEASAAR